MSKTEINDKEIFEELKRLFSSAIVEPFNIKGKDYFNVVIEKQVENPKIDFKMITISGYILRELPKIIEGKFHVSSIDNTFYKNKLQTEILIVEGVRN